MHFDLKQHQDASDIEAMYQELVKDNDLRVARGLPSFEPSYELATKIVKNLRSKIQSSAKIKVETRSAKHLVVEVLNAAVQGELPLKDQNPVQVMTAALDGWEEPRRWRPTAAGSQMEREEEWLVGLFPRSGRLIKEFYGLLSDMAMTEEEADAEPDGNYHHLDAEAKIESSYAKAKSLIAKIAAQNNVSLPVAETTKVLARRLVELVLSTGVEGECELCGTVAELRPYGPNGERICFKCGMKDEKTTANQFSKVHGL